MNKIIFVHQTDYIYDRTNPNIRELPWKGMNAQPILESNLAQWELYHDSGLKNTIVILYTEDMNLIALSWTECNEWVTGIDQGFRSWGIYSNVKERTLPTPHAYWEDYAVDSWMDDDE